ncbi:TonB-dependent receptor domain-containing protein [uncultured Bacteroides sp.]|uniref:TonB-dependent receptor domain-containing protein n=1 Tax=uncultured Bacteroides sp. TaxID=162156 RepID=UPI002AA806FF|nr:TonB-dependent receptor [uncultured Bacteroides sp.]
MKQYITLSLFSILSIFSAGAQQIKGRVIDGVTSEPLPFANILVVNKDSSAVSVGTVTDMDGNFLLVSKKEKEAVRISYLGYLSKDTVIVRNELNKITLAQDAKMLGEVVVKGVRNHFKMENGGIAMDVASSPLKNIGTANDVLEKLPFVVKEGDAFTVLGKGKPLIYINNRLVRNENELERLASGNIKKVTVITNPGPEYDATVSAVIRIEAIRPPGEGLGGELLGGIKAARLLSANGSLDLNYRKNKLDLFAYYGYTDDRRKVKMKWEQSLKSDSRTTGINSGDKERSGRREHYVETGLNYEFNEHHSAGVQYTYDGTPYARVNMGMQSEMYINDALSEEFPTTALVNIDRNSHLLNTYYVGDLFSWLKAQLDFDYAKGNNETLQNSWSGRETDENVNTKSLQNYHLYAGKLSLITPLRKGELKYGTEFSRTTNEQNYIVIDNEGAEDLTSNTNLSRQKMFAAFANYSNTIGKWTLGAGVRFENTGFDYFEDGTKMDGQSRTYTDFFPNASVSYRTERIQMMLGYRSTIERPSYYQLRNSVQYDNPYTYEAGNPYLKPTRIDDITYTLLWGKIKVMAAYKLYDNFSLLLPGQYEDKDIIMFRPENLKNVRNLSAFGYYSPHFGIWEPVAGIGILKDILSYGEIVNRSYEKPYLRYSLKNTLRLPAGFTVMIDFQGNSKGHSSLDYMYDNFRMDMQVTKTFMNDKLVLNMKGTDITGSYRQKYLMDVYPVTSFINKDLDSRSFQLSIRYKFNASRSKYKGTSASEEERQRM